MNYSKLASAGRIEKTEQALKSRNFEPVVVGTKAEALSIIKFLIPSGASVMNGSSKTLEEIGFVEYLKSGEHGWNNFHKNIVTETDPLKQKLLRRQAALADFYLGSVHALAETGEMLFASGTGSQLPSVAFTSPNVILVVGTQKITPNLQKAFKRLEEYVIPLEDKRMKEKNGIGTIHSKTLILHREDSIMGRKIKVILVNEPLGY